MMKKLYLFTLMLLASFGISNLNAQTILFSENFGGGAIPASWTNTSIPAWTYTTVGSDLGEALTSATAAGGYVMFDSDFFYGTGVHNADLITSSFVTTGQTTVRLQFQELFRKYGTSLGTVSVRKNNGAWNVVYTIGTGMAQNDVTNNPNLVDIDISTFASNSTNVQLKFNFTGNNDYWWMLDDIFVYSPPPYDVAIDSFYLSEYTAVPLGQVTPITPAIGVTNLGANAATNLTVNVNIYNGANALVFNSSMNQASLAVGASTNLVSSTSFTPTSVDFYLAEYIITINETDADLSNDTIYSAIDITDLTYARDYFYLNGNVNGLDGPWFLGASNDGQAGNVFTAEADAELVSAIATFDGSFDIGDQTQANLYSMSGGVPGALIASSPVFTVAQADTPVIFYEFFFPAGTNLTAGNDYLITVQQNAASSVRFALYSATSLYTPNTSFIQINGGAWTEINSAGVGEQTFMIRANVNTPYVPQDCEDLIISEIVEGGGSNKCLELYNPTTNPIDLSDYSINVYNNGGGSPNTNTLLTGTVPAMGTFVICNSGSSAAFLALADATNFNDAVNYNGNDVIELLRGSDVIDIIGEVGSAANFNLNQTLVRNEDVLVGDLDGSNAFDASVWTAFPQDYSSSLGFHYSDCNPVCRIDSVVAGTQTACVNTNNEYTQEVIVYFHNAPTTGTLNVNGQTFTIGTSPQTVTLTGLDSDGVDVDAVVLFSAEAACTLTETALFTAPTACLCPTITVTVNTTDVVNCATADGTVTTTVSGGTAPYTYAWTPTLPDAANHTSLSAGTYSVEVTDDNGCTGNGSGSISNPSGSVSAVLDSSNNITCIGAADGEVFVTTSGGTAPYTYSWTNSTQTTEDLSGLSVGTYTLTVTDDNSCSFTLPTVTITEPTAITVSLVNNNDVTCNGANDGSINMSVSGGTSPYTYSWTNSTATTEDLAGLGAGIYTLTVTDANGCTEVGSNITIAEPTAIVVTVDSSSDLTCNGANNGSIDVSVNGGTAPYTYSWLNSTETTEDLSNLAANDYTLTVTDDEGCTAVSAQVTIVEPAVITATSSTTAESTSGAADGTATVVAADGTAPYTYVWNDANNQTTATATGLAAGNYVVAVTDANGCTVSLSVVVDLGSGIKQISLNDFNVYPNPASKNVTISFDVANAQDMNVKFFNTIGKVVLSETINVNSSFNKTFNVSDFAEGIYFIEISNENGKTIKKLTVTK